LFCNTTSYTCVALLAFNVSCVISGLGAVPSYCATGTCASPNYRCSNPVNTGSLCSVNSDCVPGDYCPPGGGTCSVAGGRTQGQSCSVNAACSTGLCDCPTVKLCAATAKTCLVPGQKLASGTACGSDYQCASGYCACNATLGIYDCTASYCEAPSARGVNAGCTETTDCAAGLTCSGTSTTPGTCLAYFRGTSGSSCFSSNDCQIGLICSSEVCTAQSTCSSVSDCSFSSDCTACVGGSLSCSTPTLNQSSAVAYVTLAATCTTQYYYPAVADQSWLPACDDQGIFLSTSSCTKVASETNCCANCLYSGALPVEPTSLTYGIYDCSTFTYTSFNGTSICSPTNFFGYNNCPVPTSAPTSSASLLVINAALLLLAMLFFF